MAEPSTPRAFAKLSKEIQRAALAVTHLEEVTLEQVIRAIAQSRRDGYWVDGFGIDDYLSEIRRAIRFDRHAREEASLAAGKVVSLAAFRARRATK